MNKWYEEISKLDNSDNLLKTNSQNRTVKMIIGHMVDSVSNNTHRLIHMQYQESPLILSNYANNGNNDRWISIQNYQMKDWHNHLSL